MFVCLLVQLLASFLRLPLWLPSWPSMPEVPHQSHATLVPDTHVYSKHRRAQSPQEMFVLKEKRKKKEGGCLSFCACWEIVQCSL